MHCIRPFFAGAEHTCRVCPPGAGEDDARAGAGGDAAVAAVGTRPAKVRAATTRETIHLARRMGGLDHAGRSAIMRRYY
jgi:hypothetical protein